MKVEKLTVLLMLALAGCCEFCRENAPTYLMDQDFKDYTLFPVGSYWIYSEDILNGYDSVYLFRQDISMTDSYRIHSYRYDYFRQSSGTTFFNDTLFGGSGTERYDDSIYYQYAERYVSNFLVTNIQFFNRIPAGTILDLTDDSQVKYIGEFVSFTAGGIEWKSVRGFENLVQTDDRLPRKIYFAKGIGVVRKELFNGQTWNLERYNINR